MRTWVEEALTRLPPDQQAIVMGVEPQGVIAFDHATVLPALVENAHSGITAAMVAAREATNQAIVDANTVKTKRKQAYLAEVANNLFVGLERALKPNAPLLLNKFKAAYPQGGAYVKYHDGKRAWDALGRRVSFLSNRSGGGVRHRGGLGTRAPQVRPTRSL